MNLLYRKLNALLASLFSYAPITYIYAIYAIISYIYAQNKKKVSRTVTEYKQKFHGPWQNAYNEIQIWEYEKLEWAKLHLHPYRHQVKIPLQW